MAPARPGSRALAGDAETRGPPRQSNDLNNGAEQSQAGAPADDKGHCCSSTSEKQGPSQSVDQTQNASNSIAQNATAHFLAVNASPNVAIGNSGRVKQDSSASSGAVAVNTNHSRQSNELRNDAGQSQTGGKGHAKCGRCGSRPAPRSQDVHQSQNASSSISQNAKGRSAALNASPNVAVLNRGGGKCGKGGVRQSSNASSNALAFEDNRTSQSNTLDQSAEQKQRGPKHGDHGCRNPCRDECNPCKDERDRCGRERGCDD